MELWKEIKQAENSEICTYVIMIACFCHQPTPRICFIISSF